MPRPALRLALALGVLVALGCAAAAPHPPSVNVTGKWTGVCSGCIVTRFTLVLAQEGSGVSGTVVTEGDARLAAGFGVGEKPILSGRVSGDEFSFQAKDPRGVPWDVRLTVSSGGKTMEGPTTYGRAQFRVKFTHLSE